MRVKGNDARYKRQHEMR
jgi:hypothetical protein